MPIIPKYGGIQVDQQLTARSGVRVDPDVNNMQAVNSLGNQVLQLQQRVAQTEAEEALTAFERDKNAMFFDPKTGYFNTQGRDAYDTAPDVNKNLEALKQTYSSKLHTPQARQAFDRVATQHVTRASEDVMRHAGKNLQAWEVSTINAQIENSVENASLYWNDTKRLGVQRELGRQSVIESARLEGISPEATAERLQTYESTFAGAAIRAATMKGSSQGSELLETYRDRLEGPDLLQMESLISKKHEAEVTQQESAFVVTGAGRLVEQYGDLPDARSRILEQVNATEDPEVRKKLTKEVMYQLDSKLKADSESRAATFEAAENFRAEGGSIEQFISQNPDQWHALSPKQKQSLQEGSSVPTDYVMLSDLLTLPKEKLAQVNPTDHYDSLAKADRTKLINAVKSARQGTPDHQVGRTRATETTAAVEQLFGAKTKRNTKDAAKVNAFHSLVSDEVQFREDKKGAPLTSQEYTELLAGMTRKVVKEREFWFDTETDLSEVPGDHLRSVSDYLHQNNIPATAENILKVYEKVK